MKHLRLTAFLILLPWFAYAQSTGTQFPTPNGQIAPAEALLVPCGSIVNGQPVMCPPGPANPLMVTCANCSPSAPIGAGSNPVNGTITSTGVFQLLLPLNPQRKSCVFQNRGTSNMFFSVATVPTTANSLVLSPGGFYYCTGRSNVTIIDTISISGTAGDAFAGQWQ